jgi:hypothetical protein
MALVALLACGAPTRLVVGLSGADARRAGASSGIEAMAHGVRGRIVQRLPFAVVIEVPSPEASLTTLRQRREVRWVEPEQRIRVRLRAASPDPLYPEQWNLHATTTTDAGVDIDVEPAWAETRGRRADGSAVRVAIIDDGFDLAHPELEGRFAPERFNLSAGLPGDGDVAFRSGDFHGTETAGVIAAAADNGIGLRGVCPECLLVPVRLLGGGGPADLYEIDSSVAAAAIVWAVDEGHADVINNSWGPPDGSPYTAGDEQTLYAIPRALDEALFYAVRQGRGGLGAVVTWAAGNGAELATYDRFASHPAVLAVGAVDARGRLAFYSDFGPTVSLVAPSSGAADLPAITTCDISGDGGLAPGDYLASFSGTSAAAATVAGAAALVLARYPALTAAQVMEALRLGAQPIDVAAGHYDASGRSLLYGFGRLDVALALAVASTYADGCTHGFELCGNGLDDDCNGEVDDADRCAPCIPDAPHELCDGRDNDCDGLVDEDFACQSTERPVCAPCTASAECATDARCRPAAGFPGSYCFALCGELGECASGTTCDGEVCRLDTSDAVRSCADVHPCGGGGRDTCAAPKEESGEAVTSPRGCSAARADLACLIGLLGLLGILGRRCRRPAITASILGLTRYRLFRDKAGRHERD